MPAYAPTQVIPRTHTQKNALSLSASIVALYRTGRFTPLSPGAFGKRARVLSGRVPSPGFSASE